jgi:hypothetical protein
LWKKVLFSIGNILPELKFELLGWNTNGTAVLRKYRGPWLIFENGYL